MWGLRRLAYGGEDGRPQTYWNLALRHLPAAFGYAFRGDLYWKRAGTNLLGSLYAYGNGERLLPGVDATLLNLSLGPLALSPRLALWLQPRRLRYDSGGVTPGGLVGVRLGWQRWERVQPF